MGPLTSLTYAKKSSLVTHARFNNPTGNFNSVFASDHCSRSSNGGMKFRWRP